MVRAHPARGVQPVGRRADPPPAARRVPPVGKGALAAVENPAGDQRLVSRSASRFAPHPGRGRGHDRSVPASQRARLSPDGRGDSEAAAGLAQEVRSRVRLEKIVQRLAEDVAVCRPAHPPLPRWPASGVLAELRCEMVSPNPERKALQMPAGGLSADAQGKGQGPGRGMDAVSGV